MSKIPWESARRQWFYLPNLISSLRILAFWYPAYLLWTGFSSPTQRWAATIWFAIIAATDYVDGFIARKWKKLATDWGAFIDPVGDKLLVITTMIVLCVVYYGQPFWWVVVGSSAFFLAREVILTIQIGLANERPQPSIWSGKVKTTLQMAMIIAWMTPFTPEWVWLVVILTIAAWVSTFTSWVDYYRAFVRRKASTE